MVRRITAMLLWALAAGVAAATLLGPLVTDVLDYRTSDTTLNQIIGGDLAGLVLVVPVAVTAGVLIWRRHPAGPVLALAPAVWAVYMYPQIIVGQEYQALPGNNEHFFPLLLTLFVLGEAVVVLAWRLADTRHLQALPRRREHTTGVVLLLLAVFLTVGLHLPSLVDVLSGQPPVEYTSSPTAFWIVKLMDLGIIVPAAVTIGIGLLKRASWARQPAYVLLGGYTLLGAAVAGMAIVMYVNGDPDGSLANVIAFAAFAGVLVWLTATLYRPLLTADQELPEVEQAAERVGARLR